MRIEVIVPSLSVARVQHLVDSLAVQTRLPDLVTIVSNEMTSDDIRWGGLKGRVLHFTSDVYAIGEKDVALRDNVGIFNAQCDVVLIAGDDQICPSTGIEDWEQALRKAPFVWGHHRLFNEQQIAHGYQNLYQLPRCLGESREHGVNRWHGYYSAYSGSFGIYTELLQKFGGFDMLFNGRHAGEDQNLGLRLAYAHGHGNRVFIHEPPFWWHPHFSVRRTDWGTPAVKNTCTGMHTFREEPLLNGIMQRCTQCPYWHYTGDGALTLTIPFDKTLVAVSEK